MTRACGSAASPELHANVRASTDAAELGDVDLVIIASKALAVEACAKMIEGHFPGAHVLMIQNGLGCEEMVSRFGDWPIISGVTFMSGTRHADTHVEYELDTATWMGPWAEGSATFEYVRQVEELFIRSGLKAEAYEDLLPHQWSKLIFNSAVNRHLRAHGPAPRQGVFRAGQPGRPGPPGVCHDG